MDKTESVAVTWVVNYDVDTGAHVTRHFDDPQEAAKHINSLQNAKNVRLAKLTTTKVEVRI